MKNILLYFTNIRVVLAFFLLTQAGIKMAHLDSPSDDFANFYYPNAINWLNDGSSYSTPDGLQWITNGDISRHGGQPPAYSLLIASVWGIGGGISMLFVLNVLMLMVAVWFSFKIFQSVTDNKVIIFGSLWVMVLSPPFIFITKFYNSEGMFTVLLAACFYFLVKAFQQQKSTFYIMGLLFLLASILTRSINMYMAPFLLLPFLVYAFPLKKKILFAGITFFFMIAISGIGSNDSSSYLRRTIADGLKRYEGDAVANKLIESVKPHKGKWETNFVNANFECLKTEPIGLLKFWLFKSFKVWYGTDSGGQQGLLLLFQGLHLLAFWVCAFLFLFRKLKHPVVLLFFMGVLYTNVLATVNLSIVRYLVPMTPFYIFCTAYLCHRFISPYFNKASIQS